MRKRRPWTDRGVFSDHRRRRERAADDGDRAAALRDGEGGAAGLHPRSSPSDLAEFGITVNALDAGIDSRRAGHADLRQVRQSARPDQRAALLSGYPGGDPERPTRSRPPSNSALRIGWLHLWASRCRSTARIADVRARRCGPSGCRRPVELLSRSRTGLVRRQEDGVSDIPGVAAPAERHARGRFPCAREDRRGLLARHAMFGAMARRSSCPIFVAADALRA